jgi:FKBP-type peptidyl-prolyl cis-trans isomerase FklB
MCNIPQSASQQPAQQTVTTASNDQPERTSISQDDYATLNARRENVVVLPSSVQYEVLQTGDGTNRPAANDTVLINYQTSLADGRVIDSTYNDGQPAKLAINTIKVPGLKEALLLMDEGAKWRVVVPPKMGFGRSGNNKLRRRDLIYEIELVSIVKPETAAK